MVKKPQIIDIIRYMRTDLRRWWVINRLYHLQKNFPGEPVSELKFFFWINGISDKSLADLDTIPNSIFFVPVSDLKTVLITKMLFKTDKNAWKDLKSVIDECIDLKWIERQFAGHNLTLKLLTDGKSNYAFSSGFVFFCNKYKLIGYVIYAIFFLALLPIFKYLIFLVTNQ